jgi:hypothetical protein
MRIQLKNSTIIYAEAFPYGVSALDYAVKYGYFGF